MPLWTPSRTSTHLWLDAADASTIFDAASGGSLTADGGFVGRIEDKSGNARHATQSTSANRPVRSGASISFVDKWLSIPVSAWAINRLLIGVFNSSGTGWISGGFINIQSTPIDNPELRWGTGASGDNCGHYWNGGYAVSNTTSYGLSTSSVHATTVATDGTLTQWRNGTQSVTGTRTASWSTINEFTIGKFITFLAQTGRAGTLRELIVCNPSDRQITEGYLAWKWSLQSSLDDGHPYKSAAPTVPGGSSPINGQSLIRPAGSAAQQLLIQGAIP